MNYKKDFISIIIPLYNSQDYIQKTLESVFYQTYINWECIVIDDGSTDNSAAIVMSFCKKDKRFKYYYQKNSGPSSARNKGMELAKGRFIQFLDADDVLLPERFNLLLKYYKMVDNNIILYSNFLLGNNKKIYVTTTLNRPSNIGKDIFFDDMYTKFALDFLVIPACFLFPSRAVSGITWNEDFKYSEDWDYYLTILNNGYSFRYMEIPLVIYRNTPEGLSKDIIQTTKANLLILRKWNNKQLFFVYIKRVSILLKKNFFYLITKKTNTFVFPFTSFKKKSIYFIITQLFILPYTVFLILKEFYHIFHKHLTKTNEI